MSIAPLQGNEGGLGQAVGGRTVVNIEADHDGEEQAGRGATSVHIVDRGCTLNEGLSSGHSDRSSLCLPSCLRDTRPALPRGKQCD